MVFLGTLSSYADDAFVLWARRDAGAKSLADLMRPDSPELKVGGSASGSTDDATVILLRDLTGMRLKLITGYPDGNSIALALERGELEGRTSGVSSISATHPDWMRPDGHVHAIVQVGRKTRLPVIAHVPTARELARDDRGRAIIETMETPYQFARPFVLPPGLPADRQAALRKAFMAASNSPGLRAEAAKLAERARGMPQRDAAADLALQYRTAKAAAAAAALPVLQRGGYEPPAAVPGRG
jgi:tripartite-type tricarboxylate transporter receptor subunit TctC